MKLQYFIILTILYLYVFTLQGDSCPPGAAVIPLAGPDCSTLQYVLIFTTGVTCVALLLDLAKRYLFSPPATKDKATLTEEDVLALVKSSREVNGNYSGKF